ncbi:MAG: copper amine oxidase-like protein [Frankiales bacterium]|nr:copper amine oxidase-like protein [Frankiales bacterium]
MRVVGTALGATLLLAVGAASSRATQLEPVSRTASVQLSAEVAPSPIAAPLQARTIRTQPAVPPTVTPLARPRVNAQPVAVRRWLPTGTGMWLHEWARSEGGNGRAVVARAKRVGLSTLFVRTGSTHDGWTGTPTLRSLLPATRGTGIKVVAWDFPELVDPAADALRMARAARFSCPGCPRVAAVAPDVETAAEGTRIGEQTVARYYSTLRRALPRDVAILATVPWPSEMRTGHYPYARTASLVDALMPMAYWYNRSPAVVTATSMAYLRRFHKPVMPVGQGYDGRIDAPNLAADPDPGGSVRSFLRTAKRRGARSVSLWSWQTTGGQQWAALAGARGLFRPKLLTPRR